jgi:hypothetical protein
VPILENEKEVDEKRDLELDNAVAQLGISEYQANRLFDFLAGRIDRSNPVAFSKGSSIHAFERGSKEYRITIDVDPIETKDKPIIYSFRNAVRSPAFIITSTLCSAIICLLAFVSPYLSSPIDGSFSERELDMLDSQYSLVLDRCAILMNDHRPNPRSFGALYSTCNKAIVQLEEFCKEHYIASCEHERIEKNYLMRNNPRL